MTDEPTEPAMSNEPFDRLTTLCQTMTDALDEALAAETGEHPPIRTIVFLEDDERAGIVTHGYEDSLDAMGSLFIHMKAIFQAHGKDLEFIAVPDSPEGVTDV